MSEYIPEKRNFRKGCRNANDLESVVEALKRREQQIQTVAATGDVSLTNQLCASLIGEALSNVLTSRKSRDRNLYMISNVQKYIESHWDNLPASEIAEMQDEIDQARRKTWAEFKGLKNYYKNDTPEFIREQMAIAEDRSHGRGKYYPRQSA